MYLEFVNDTGQTLFYSTVDDVPELDSGVEHEQKLYMVMAVVRVYGPAEPDGAGPKPLHRAVKVRVFLEPYSPRSSMYA